MAQEIAGQLDGSGLKFAVVVGRFNSFITGKLVEGTLDCLIRHGVADDDITLAWTPGSFEIPPVAARLARTGNYDAVICVGAVIRGGTPHFDYVAAETAKNIAKVAMDAEVPVLLGVLTCDTLEQAIERAGAKAGNKGFDAALAAIEMAALYRKL